MKKKKKINFGSGGSGWLTTFNDLITLLMVFFVMLFTMSSIDIKKLKDFQNALQSGLGVLKEGQRVSVGLTEPPITPSDVESVMILEEIEEKVPNEIRDFVKAFDSEPEITATYTKKGVLITLSNTILFQFGMADINLESFPVLDKIAAIISKTSESVRVEGHTDNLPIHTEKFPSNWELSIKRAVNVVKYFVGIGKIPPQRLSAVGYGESKPLFPNDTTEHRAANRRVEILLEMEGEG